jgi:hypothetical protein
MIKYTRRYSTAENAERTVSALRSADFGDDVITFSGPATVERFWTVSVQAPFGMGRPAIEILDKFDPIEYPHPRDRVRDPGLDLISELSKDPPPGAIPSLSRRISAGAISKLSGPVGPGAISRLSRPVPPGPVATLSRRVSPGAISRLSRPVTAGAVSSLSSGWYFSNLLGLPLLTRSQKPVEPDSTLLVDEQQLPEYRSRRAGGQR